MIGDPAADNGAAEDSSCSKPTTWVGARVRPRIERSPDSPAASPDPCPGQAMRQDSSAIPAEHRVFDFSTFRMAERQDIRSGSRIPHADRVDSNCEISGAVRAEPRSVSRTLHDGEFVAVFRVPDPETTVLDRDELLNRVNLTPFLERRSTPEVASQRRVVPSALEVTIRSPRGLNRTLKISSVWPVNVRSSLPVRAAGQSKMRPQTPAGRRTRRHRKRFEKEA